MLGLHGPSNTGFSEALQTEGFENSCLYCIMVLFIITSISNNLLISIYLHYIVIADLCITVPHFDVFQCCNPSF